MKRRLTKLVVFLLLGATVNVAVAWGCAVWSPKSQAGLIREEAYDDGARLMARIDIHPDRELAFKHLLRRFLSHAHRSQYLVGAYGSLLAVRAGMIERSGV